jgi:hypothetical protein
MKILITETQLHTLKEHETFIKKMISDIDQISTIDQLTEEFKKITMGGFIPFNPPDPLRSIYRKKLHQLLKENPKEKNKMMRWLSPLQGKYQPTPPLPPGAMY